MLKKGDEYKNFYVIDVTDVKDYKSTGIWLRHKTTGLEVFHLLNNEEENLFSYCFRTPVSDDKGLPHIIEHSVLCGSEKYHLKEPFSTLGTKTVTSFLNALTYSDKTCYPGASVVESEYFKMMDVYSDAVFFPLLSEDTFNQEGHRFELDENGNLSIQGVVYNEMKGQFSDFGSVAFYGLAKAMFPNTAYEKCSGGDPLAVKDLTYQEFLDFHKKYYSPQNCLLYLYGNIPTEKQIDYIAEKFAARLEEKFNLKTTLPNYKSELPLVYPEITELEKITPIEKTRECHFTAPKAGMEGNAVGLAWYSGGPATVEKWFLSDILGGSGPASITRRLEESQLGDSIFISGNVNSYPEEFFAFSLLGVKKGNEQKVRKLIQDAIKEISEMEITQDEIDGAIMSIDFFLREIKRDWGPFALTIMDNVMRGWGYGKVPTDQLSPIQAFEKVKAKVLADKKYVNELIKKYLCKDYEVYFEIEPSESFLEERNQKEADAIKEAEKSLNKEDLKKELDRLHEYQNAKDSAEELEKIPRLGIKDLSTKLPDYSSKISKLGNLNFFTNEQETNGIVYLNVMFPMDNLEPKHYPLMQLFANTFLGLGWGDKSWSDAKQELFKIVGNAYACLVIGSVPDTKLAKTETEKHAAENFIGRDWLQLRVKVMDYKLGEALKIISDILSGLKFSDAERMKTIIRDYATSKKTELVAEGRDHCMKRAYYKTSKTKCKEELFWGITSVQKAISIKEDDVEKILAEFREIYKAIFDSGCILQVTADADSIKETEKLLPDFIAKTNLKSLAPSKDYPLADYLQHVYKSDDKGFDVIKVDTQAGYAVKVFPSSAALSPDVAAEELLSYWHNGHSFWEKLRTVHGCYGANMGIDSYSGFDILFTYRDPDPVGSLAIFDECLSEVAQMDMSEEDLICSKIASYRDYIRIQIMAPEEKGHMGLKQTLYAQTHEQRELGLKNALAITSADIKRVAKLMAERARSAKIAIMCDKATKISGNELGFAE